VRDGFQNLWKDPNGEPTAVYIGCPHNTYQETEYWCQKLHKALKDTGQEKLAIPVVMSSPYVIKEKLLDEHPLLYRDMVRAGVQFTNICTPAFQGLKGMADIDRGVTNSNKARFYSRLRLYDDDDLVQIALTGKVPY
jgi:predicted aconitase